MRLLLILMMLSVPACAKLLSQASLKWDLNRAQIDSKAYLVRVARNVQPLAKSKRLPDRVGLAVPFLHGGDQRELAGLNQLEDAIIRKFCSGDKSRLVLVITGTEMREYVFQTADGARLAKELRGITHLAGGHDLQTVVENDPQWLVWRQFLNPR